MTYLLELICSHFLTIPHLILYDSAVSWLGSRRLSTSILFQDRCRNEVVAAKKGYWMLGLTLDCGGELLTLSLGVVMIRRDVETNEDICVAMNIDVVSRKGRCQIP